MGSHVSSRVRRAGSGWASGERRAAAVVVTAFAAVLIAGCDRDEAGAEDPVPIRSPEPGEGPRRVDVKGGVPSGDRGQPTPGCLAFCEKSNRCAAEDGRPMPPGARPCAAACAPGGLYRLAPAGALACVDRPCGAFNACAERALIEAARASDLPVFPRKCTGLCHKLAWCAERLGYPSPDTVDCELACEEAGPLSAVPRPAHGCVDAPCGGEMIRCLEAGGTPAPLIQRLFSGLAGQATGE